MSVTIFLSSTFLEFKDLRKHLKTQLESTGGHRVTAMEKFPTFASEVEAECRQKLKQSQLGLLILGDTYGSVGPHESESFTEIEFEAIQLERMPWLAFVMPAGPDRDPRQVQFIERVRQAAHDAGTSSVTTLEHVPPDIELLNLIGHAVNNEAERLGGQVDRAMRRSRVMLEEQLRAGHDITLGNALDTVAATEGKIESNEFQRKYNDELTISRSPVIGSKTEDASTHFWKTFVAATDRDGRNCYAFHGKTGHGKTSLLCDLVHRGPPLAVNIRPLSVLVAGSNLNTERGELARHVLRSLQSENAPTPRKPVREMVQLFERLLRERENLRVVVFIDAINEIPRQPGGPDPFTWFNEEMNEVLEALDAGRVGSRALSDRVLFCISCREEYWEAFARDVAWASWLGRIFGKQGAGLVTFTLGPFNAHELEAALPAYLKRYRLDELDLKITGDAYRMLHEPVMLRYFCEAYGTESDKEQPKATRGQEIDSISRIEVFKLMVEKFRAQLEALEVLSAKGDMVQLASRYLMRIAWLTYKRGNADAFPIELVKTAAVAIGHPDRHIDGDEILTSPDSVFRALVGHGLLLGGKGDGRAYKFIFDSYFEFTLGRFIVFEVWQHVSNASVLRWLRKQMQSFDNAGAGHASHDAAMRRSRFAFMLGAIRYACLLVETTDEFADRRPLFSELIEEMLGERADRKPQPRQPRTRRKAEQGDSNPAEFRQGIRSRYLWMQQALSILRDSSLASKRRWNEHAASGSSASELESMLESLAVVARKNDHVIQHDLETTLLRYARASETSRVVVRNRLDNWVKHFGDNTPSDRILRIFAAGTLLRLSEDRESGDHDSMQRRLKELLTMKTVGDDFWVARSITRAITTMTSDDTWTADDNADERARTFDALADLAESHRPGTEAEPAFSPAIAIRGEAVATLAAVASGDLDLLAELFEWMLDEPHAWAWWRLVHQLLEQPPSHLVSDAITRANLVRLPIGVASPELNLAVRLLRDKYKAELGIALPLQVAADDLDYEAAPDDHADQFGDATDGLIVYHPIFLEPAYANHPECRERLASVLGAIRGADDLDLGWLEPREIGDKLLEEVHNESTDRHRSGAAWKEYLRDVAREEQSISIAGPSTRQITGPLELRPGALRVAKYSAGSAVVAVEQALRTPTLPAAWAVNRPPGHLANNVICVLNNAAIGVRRCLQLLAKQKLDRPRALVLDFDAHHGKHTHWTFRGEPSVIYLSMHVDEGYSTEEGALKNMGTGLGVGSNFNLPFPTTTGDVGFAALAHRFVAPILLGYQPDLIMLSCGFDGLDTDPLTPQAHLSESAYAALARVVRRCRDAINRQHKVAGNRRRVAIAGTLEGGYSLPGLGPAFLEVVREFASVPRASELHLNRHLKKNATDDLGRPVPDILDRIDALIRERFDLQPTTLDWQIASQADVDRAIGTLADLNIHLMPARADLDIDG